MPYPSGSISVTAPISEAIERAKLILFRPFDLSKWFTIGFCAWLATLGEGGGYNFRGNFNRHTPSHSAAREDFRQAFDHARSFVMENLIWLLPLVIALFVLAVAVGVVLLWLNSRGKFMFLHCVALNRAEVTEPWRKYSRQGNSLFVFRLVLGLIGFIPILPLIIFALILGIRLFQQEVPQAPTIFALVLVIFGILGVALVIGLIDKLTKDFVVPIMYLRNYRCLEAWREFRALLFSRVGEFAIYLLFQIVLGIVLAILVLLAIVVTCCIACCLLLIPYLGTVLLLPLLIFKRSYSLHYLAQYGPECSVFPTAPPPASL